MYKLLLCWRYLRTRYIALASIVSVTLGVATMIVVNSVMSGFTAEMQNRIHGILSDVVVESRSASGMRDAQWHMNEIRKVVGDDLVGMTPTVVVPAMLSFQHGGQYINRPVQMIGIDPTTHSLVSDFGRFLQHPDNRQQMSFELHEDGYDAEDHQAESRDTPDRQQMTQAGWKHRREMARLAAFQEQLYQARRRNDELQRQPTAQPLQPAEPELFAVPQGTPAMEQQPREQQPRQQQLQPSPQRQQPRRATREPEQNPAPADEAQPTRSTSHSAQGLRQPPTLERSPRYRPVFSNARRFDDQVGKVAAETDTGLPLTEIRITAAEPGLIHPQAYEEPIPSAPGSAAPMPVGSPPPGPSLTAVPPPAAAPPAMVPNDPFAQHPETAPQFNAAREQQPGVVLGIALASFRILKDQSNPSEGYEDRFLVLPGDDVKLTFPTAGTPPKAVSDAFTVVDFYESKMSEYDSSFVFVPLETLQQSRGMIDPATGVGLVNSIQIKLKPGVDGGAVRDKLRAAFAPELYSVETWRDKQGALLAAVHLETTILNILLFLIIAVAGFGILAIFLMIVVEKTRDIGVLKSLGASGQGVMGIFLTYGLSLGAVGSGVGTVLGLMFVWKINEIADLLGKITGRPVFDPSIYYFYKIPTIVNPLTIAWIVAGAMGIAVLASVLPAMRAAMLHPVEALRYE